MLVWTEICSGVKMLCLLDGEPYCKLQVHLLFLLKSDANM